MSEPTRRYAQCGDKIVYRTERLANGHVLEHAATIIDLDEKAAYLDNGSYLLRGAEYDLATEHSTWVR